MTDEERVEMAGAIADARREGYSMGYQHGVIATPANVETALGHAFRKLHAVAVRWLAHPQLCKYELVDAIRACTLPELGAP